MSFLKRKDDPVTQRHEHLPKLTIDDLRKQLLDPSDPCKLTDDERWGITMVLDHFKDDPSDDNADDHYSFLIRLLTEWLGTERLSKIRI